MDPITALGVATTAFNTIKKGFQLGKDANAMLSDVGKWMNAMDIVKTSHEKHKKKGSVEEEALETFGAIKKAKAMEDELRNFLIASYGMDAWNQLLRIQAQVRKKRKLELVYQRKQREDMINAIIIFVGVIGGGALLLFVFIGIF